MDKAFAGLIRRIQNALSPDLLLPKYRDVRSNVRSKRARKVFGFCYIASEALYHVSARKAGYRPAVMRVLEGTHWFLRDQQGRILDPTVEQFKMAPDYSQGRGCGFLTRKPSKRARALMDRL